MTSLPIVGITLGDAAGIGPEVIAKALRRPEVYQVCRPLVIGDARIFAEPKFAAPAPRLLIINTISQAVFASGMVTVLDLHNLHPNAVAMGAVCPASGRAAVAYVVEAAKLALAGKIDALATAPLNKEAMRQAGFDYIGHTEILADVTQTSKCTTMLATTGLRVTHVTRHIPFREIAGYITRDNVLDAIRLTHDGMQRLGFAQPRLAVAALNPHNGEGGLLGREELDEIGPAVTAARGQGLLVEGPLPADSVFFKALRDEFDVVVCMYHDQGHIAIKTHGFETSITITLGIPVIRTSADHGTAFDIAGQGIADSRSMLQAILEAAKMAARLKVMQAERSD